MAGAFYRLTATGAVLRVRVTPNAGADRLEGVESRSDGEMVLRTRVSAAPDKGKANAAVIGLLAKSLAMPKSTLGIVAGASGRLKTIAITGDAIGLAARLEALAGKA
jgi:uncharacterized protein YggU (UPF0235/DUF167 family)